MTLSGVNADLKREQLSKDIVRLDFWRNVCIRFGRKRCDYQKKQWEAVKHVRKHEKQTHGDWNMVRRQCAMFSRF